MAVLIVDNVTFQDKLYKGSGVIVGYELNNNGRPTTKLSIKITKRWKWENGSWIRYPPPFEAHLWEHKFCTFIGNIPNMWQIAMLKSKVELKGRGSSFVDLETGIAIDKL